MTENGTKTDQGKVRLDLLPPKALVEVGEILTEGANEYGAYNWTQGLTYSRLFAASLRHLLSWWGGETIDPKSGKNHLAHVACNMLFLLEMRRIHPELDDRPW